MVPDRRTISTGQGHSPPEFLPHSVRFKALMCDLLQSNLIIIVIIITSIGKAIIISIPISLLLLCSKVVSKQATDTIDYKTYIIMMEEALKG